jgi:hypothetical protein
LASCKAPHIYFQAAITHLTQRPLEEAMRIGTILLIIWLIIGAVAAGQRHYFGNSSASCAKTSTVAVTIGAGPLNYVGVNPKISCKTPQPSQ